MLFVEISLCVSSHSRPTGGLCVEQINNTVVLCCPVVFMRVTSGSVCKH